MNYKNIGAIERHSTFPLADMRRTGSVAAATARPALLSTLELRRLVAEMVD